MFAHVAIALFVSFVAIEAKGKAVPERPPCGCYPDRMTGEVHYRGRKKTPPQDITMFAPVAIALFVSFVAIEANEGPSCECYPDRMSGEVYFFGYKIRDFYVDYNLQKMVESSHDTFRGPSKFVYDLAKKIRYRIRSDGSCRAYPLSHIEAFEGQCMPAGAIQSKETSDSISFRYGVKDVTVERTLDKNTCFPMRIATEMGKAVMEYKQFSTTFDESVLDVDVSHCRQF